MKRKAVPEDARWIEKILQDLFGEEEFVSSERLGGLTNRTYHVVRKHGESTLVRLPGEGTEELIDRKAEEVSTRLASELSLDTELIAFTPDGVKVMEFVEDAKPMSAEVLRRPEMRQQVASIFHTLHTSGRDTKVPFEVFEMAAQYEDLIRKNNVALPVGYDAVKADIMALKERIDAQAKGTPIKAPCHNDSLVDNWVLAPSGRLYLVDWEYAGMNDPMWDLADISIEAEYRAEDDAKLLEEYFGREPKESETLRFGANKLYLDYLWTLWGKTRVPYEGEPMEEYAAERWARLLENREKMGL